MSIRSLIYSLALSVSGIPSEAGDVFPPADPWARTAASNVVEGSDPSAALSFRQEIDSLRSEVDRLLKSETDRKQRESEKPTAKLTVQLQPDAMFFSQDDANRAAVGDIENGTAFRRARIGVLGEYGPTDYRIEFDFALAGRPTFLEVWAGFKDVPGLGAVRLGHFNEPFSLERYTPNRFMTFLERSLLDSAFAPARNWGVIALNQDAQETTTWQFGGFRTGSDNFGDDVGDEGEFAGTARLTRLLWYEDDGRSLLHVGGAYSYRDTDNDVVRFRSQPEARVGATIPNVPDFVDTGFIPASHYQLVGLEAAWVLGPVSLQAESAWSPVDAAVGPNPVFHSYYVYASWFMTGEHRPYRRSIGVFDRVIPRRNVVAACDSAASGETGCGAWELAARVSHLDLNDHAVQGGRLTDVTVGLNWYMNPYLKTQFNWVHAFLDDPALGNSEADLFGVRMNYDF